MVLVVVVIMPNVVPGVEVLKQMFPGEETKSQIHKQARVLGWKFQARRPVPSQPGVIVLIRAAGIIRSLVFEL